MSICSVLLSNHEHICFLTVSTGSKIYLKLKFEDIYTRTLGGEDADGMQIVSFFLSLLSHRAVWDIVLSMTEPTSLTRS